MDPYAINIEACRGRQRRLLEAIEPLGIDLALLTRRETIQWLTGVCIRAPFEPAALPALSKALLSAQDAQSAATALRCIGESGIDPLLKAVERGAVGPCWQKTAGATDPATANSAIRAACVIPLQVTPGRSRVTTCPRTVALPSRPVPASSRQADHGQGFPVRQTMDSRVCHCRS